MKKYEELKLEILFFEAEDAVACSGEPLEPKTDTGKDIYGWL